MGIEHNFDQITYTKDLGAEKPNHMPFIATLKKLKVNAKSALFVGDNPVNDIIPAKEIGMDTMWIDHLDQNDILSDYRITDPNKISKTIRGL